MEYYHREAETMRARYNDVFLEKERLEQEVNSVRCCLEDERKEMAELRRQQQVCMYVYCNQNEHCHVQSLV